MLTLMTRPSLKTRRISRHSGKIAIVQPINHLLLLHDAHVPLAVVGSDDMFPQGARRALVRRLGIIRFDVAAADHEDVADGDVAALCARPDVDALVFAAGVELVVRDRVKGVGVVGVVVA